MSSNSDPRWLYWGVSPEGGTRLKYLNSPDSLADATDTVTEVDNAVEKLKKLAREHEGRDGNVHHSVE